MIHAVAFDFNGVIVDDEPIHYEAFRLALEPFGVALTREAYWAKYLAYDDRGALEELIRDFPKELAACDRARFLRAKVEHYMKRVGEDPPFFPGAREAVRALAAEFAMAVVSGARREEIESTLAAGGISGCFRAIVASEDVAVSKPNPEPYVRAAGLLKMEPAEIVAIEDSVGGILSARAAGLAVIAVAHTYDAADLRDAHRVVPRVADLTAGLVHEAGYSVAPAA